MKIFKLTIFCMLLVSGQAAALLKIEITGSDDNALPIAIVPFGWESSTAGMPLEIADVVSSDLERSGRFRAVPVDQMLANPHKGTNIKFENWRILEVENLLVGNVRRLDAETFVVEAQLFDVYKERQLKGVSYKVPEKELRNVAHTISDLVYEALTGEPGAFNTRLAYVIAEPAKKAGGRQQMTFRLEVADTDGYNPRAILKSPQPILSPSWSPDGRKLAYVSFENRRSEVWLHSVFEIERYVVASFKGINGAPVWSPDGKKLVITSSHGGNADIYLLDLSTKQLKKLTKSWSIDTEPAWMPDGRSLIFTSGRSGSPQLYKMDLDSGVAKRLTFEGKYNASPAISPDGRTVAMVHGHQGRYRIAVLDLDSGLFRVLTKGRLDESPSFAPNGSMLLYAAEQGGKGILAAVSIDGRTHQSLAFADGDIREPTWGPFLANQR